MILGGFVRGALKAAKELEQDYQRPLGIGRHVHLNASFHS